MKQKVWQVLSIIVLLGCITHTAYASRSLIPVLSSTDFGTAEPTISALAGTAESATFGNNKCVYDGTGHYSVKDDAQLFAEATMKCGNAGVSAGHLICQLTTNLDCGPVDGYRHHYQLTEQGIQVDNQLIAWSINQPTNVQVVLKGLVSGSGAHGKEITCVAPRSKFSTTENVMNLILMENNYDHSKKNEIDKMCDGNLFVQYLAAAKIGDTVDQNSVAGQCFTISNLVKDWATTKCTVASK